jgi:hypothetical protein
MERGPGEKLLLQEKIKQDDRIFEKGSRQTIAHVNGGNTVHFESGLRLRANDGRVRQGDCLTDYKAQGLKGVRCAASRTMAPRWRWPTRKLSTSKARAMSKTWFARRKQGPLRGGHPADECEIFRPATWNGCRSCPRVRIIPAPSVNKGKLLLAVRAWGKEFLPRMSAQKLAEQVRQQPNSICSTTIASSRSRARNFASCMRRWNIFICIRCGNSFVRRLSEICHREPNRDRRKSL